MNLYIDNRQDKVKLNRGIIDGVRGAIKETLLAEKGSLNYELSLVFVDNKEIRGLNKRYRGIDKETDVLSFPMEEEKFPMPILMLGDIIISAEKAQDQAKEYNHSLLREISYLTVHSVLHLLGYDHIEKDDSMIMRMKEKGIMKGLGIFKTEGWG